MTRASEGQEMDTVKFLGLMTGYIINYDPNKLNPYTDMKLDFILDKKNMESVARFLNGCLENTGQAGTATSFTLSVSVSDYDDVELTTTSNGVAQ